MGALDQAGECLAELFYGGADLLGPDIRGGVLKPTLENVELVQQRRLPSGQAAVGEKSFEDLVGVRARRCLLIVSKKRTRRACST
jgi:hypothetical protein